MIIDTEKLRKKLRELEEKDYNGYEQKLKILWRIEYIENVYRKFKEVI